MRIAFIGDIVGRPGRRTVRELLPVLRAERSPDLVVANAENAAAGVGVTPQVAAELFQAGIHVLTTGNHVWDKKEAMDLLDREPRILRPVNYPPGAPGAGWTVVGVGKEKVGVINLSGRVFLPSHYDCPFRGVEEVLEEVRSRARMIVVDFHAEATSEKAAMGWYLDGRVSAVVGTHTHVATSDARILPKGTAFITDVGMTGPINSVIGIKAELVLERFISQLPVRFEVAMGTCQMAAVVVDVDEETGTALGIEQWVRRSEPEGEEEGEIRG